MKDKDLFVNLDNSYPNLQKGLYLKETTYSALLNSIEFLYENTKLESKRLRKKFQSIIEHLRENRGALFCFMLLNHYLVLHYENKDFKSFETLIDNFSLDIQNLEQSIAVASFGDSFFSKQQWNLFEKISVAEFAETAVLERPETNKFVVASKYIQNALKEIKAIAPKYYDEINALVSTILILKSNRFIAGSNFSTLSLIALSDTQDFKMTVEYLIHETAHQYIFNLTVFDELCSGEGLYTSPLRKDPRPIEGIYHATFVLARIIGFYKIALRSTTNIPKRFIEEQINAYILKYNDGYNLVMKKATLTPLGKALIQSTQLLIS